MQTRQEKARAMRYKKAIVKGLNLYDIQEDLCEISEACNDVKYYIDDDETLLNAMDGDEDEEHEFRMMFADLCVECDRLQEDLQNEYIPECFDDFFVAIGTGSDSGLLGYDDYEGDYFGIDVPYNYAEKESQKRLMRLTKEQLIYAAKANFKIVTAYMGLKDRYENLKASLDILRGDNTGYLKTVKNIEKAYDKINDTNLEFHEHENAKREFDRLVDGMPEEVWLY